MFIVLLFDVVVDMVLKFEYVCKNNGGCGIILLIVMLMVNSFNDIYNMLLLVISFEEWVVMGIIDVDDFIEMYGEILMESIIKFFGEVEEKEVLVGFKNLLGFRNLFYCWVNMKDVKLVGEMVKILIIIESKFVVELFDE